MCLRYRCRSCRDIKTIYCMSANWDQVNPDCHQPTIDPQPHIKHKRCYHCQTVEGAIRKMQIMVYQKPWLETEGLAGRESRADWELAGHTSDEETDNEWEPEHNNQLVARLEAMGLGELDGREELNDGHGIGGVLDSNCTSPVGLDHDSGSDNLVSVWGSDQGTWTSGGTTNGEAMEAQGAEEIVEHDCELRFVKNYFE